MDSDHNNARHSFLVLFCIFAFRKYQVAQDAVLRSRPGSDQVSLRVPGSCCGKKLYLYFCKKKSATKTLICLSVKLYLLFLTQN